MVSYKRYTKEGLPSGHGDLGSKIGEELVSGGYRTDMGGVSE
jgi:hypothetical protein